MFERVISVPGVLPFASEENWELDSDVVIATVIFLVVPSDIVVANDLDGVDIVLTDILTCVYGGERVVVANEGVVTESVTPMVSEV